MAESTESDAAFEATPEGEFASLDVAIDAVEHSAAEIPVEPAAEHPSVDPLSRLRFLPVQVSVRLAEKRIPMSQLMNITPGMLIPFNKSCDDLLDLYVNNSRFCRGEAVKIGEKFGLKIDEVGIHTETERKVIQA